jgi:hypothetical protein
MKSIEQKHAVDMFRSLVRGDPRDVFMSIKVQVMYDFECAYKLGANGFALESLPEYELKTNDRIKLHLLIQQSFAAGNAAYKISQLQKQIAGSKQ